MALSFAIYIFTIITFALYFYIKRSHSYWKKRGVPTLEPIHPFFGTSKEMIQRKINQNEHLRKMYTEFKARGWKYGGYYVYSAHFWLPVDIELIKNILSKDFSYFMNHDSHTEVDPDNTSDPLLLNLFSSTNERWRKLRVKLTPTFSSGKLKMMFQTLLATTTGLEEILNTHAKVQDPIEMKDLIARFTTDVIGSCAFGLDCNSLKNPDSEFRKYGSRIFDVRPTGLKRIKFVIYMLAPQSIKKLLRPKFLDQDVEDFFREIVDRTVEYREKNDVFRKDFLHLLIQLKNKGAVTDDESLMKNPNEAVKAEESLTMNEVLAQCIIFFLAGFETSATTMSFALLEMAQAPEVQCKLREEINEVLKKHDGQITYESIMDMKYLDMVVHETLRKHPPLPNTPRVCTKDYQIPGTNVVIERGVGMNIPIFSIHHDPEYYPDPEKFDPERFTEENKAKRPPFSFLAFGEGPRYCIGARFGLMQTKVGLITIIKNFKISLNEKTQVPIKYVSKSIFLNVEGGIWLNVDKIE